MRTFNIHAAKTHLSRLVERLQQGRAVYYRQGREADGAGYSHSARPRNGAKHRIGFMKGKIKVPDNFDTMMRW